MKKKNGSTVVKFPNTTAQLERQTEAFEELCLQIPLTVDVINFYPYTNVYL